MMPATPPSETPAGNGQPPLSTGDEFGRVLRASTTGFAVGCRVAQLEAPSFGCMVKAQPVEEREAIYGLIYDMNIDDDPLIRRLILAENPRQSVIEDQRRNRLVPIEMSVLTIGYRRNGRFFYSLPPRPPLNLDPVHLCSDSEEVTLFTDRSDYLRLILRTVGGHVPVDQLLVAHILQTYEKRGADEAWARHTIAEIVELLRGDYELLTAVLETMTQTLPLLPDVAELTL